MRIIIKIKQHQFLFEELVRRDFTKRYKRTVFGMLWSVISPLVNLLIMWLVFGKLMGTNVNHYIIYLFSGQLIFAYFSEATNLGMTSLLGNAGIFTKVSVPKYLFLLSQNVSSLINFGVTMIVYFMFVGIEGLPFTWKFFCLIYPVICLVLFNLGIGMILSTLFVFFRDMQYLWGIATQLILWMSATFYTTDMFSDTAKKLFLLNPLYLIIRYFREVVIGGTVPGMAIHLLMMADVLLAMGVGAWMYKRYNSEFLYYV